MDLTRNLFLLIAMQSLPSRFLTLPAIRTSRISSVFHLAVAVAMGATTSLSGQLTLSSQWVGHANNVPHSPTGYGSVPYGYYVSTYEITFTEYAAFLNAVAKGDPYGLWDASEPLADGISRSGTDGAYTYTVNDTYALRPVHGVSFWDAARFANWLTTGGTETGVYMLNGVAEPTNSAITRDQAAWDAGGVALPTDDEWFKAAFFDPDLNAGDGGYWLYPIKSNELTTSDATFNASGTKNVGFYGTKPSAYTTYDQAGNVQEWCELITGTSSEARLVRGGSWITANVEQQIWKMQSTFRDFGLLPDTRNNTTGFRVVSRQIISNKGVDTTPVDYSGISVSIVSGPADYATISAPEAVVLTISGLEDPESGVSSLEASWGPLGNRVPVNVDSFNPETGTLTVQLPAPADGAYGSYVFWLKSVNGAGLTTGLNAFYEYTYADPEAVGAIRFNLIFPDGSDFTFYFPNAASMTIGELVTDMLDYSLSWPVSWVVGRPDSGQGSTALFDTSDTADSAAASSLGIAYDEQLYLVDTSVGFTVYDVRQSPPVPSGPYVYDPNTPTSAIISALQTDVNGGQPLPEGWQLYRIDDNGTADPTDDTESILLNAESSPTLAIGFIGIAQNESLFFDVRVPFNGLSLGLFVPTAQGQDQLWDLTLPASATVRDLILEIINRAQSEGATLPPHYGIGYADQTGEVIVALSKDTTNTNSLQALLPSSVANGTIPLFLLPLLKIDIQHDTFFDIGFNSSDFNYTLNGEPAPTLTLHRGRTYTFFSQSGVPSHPFVITTNPPSSGDPILYESNITGTHPLNTAGQTFSFAPGNDTPSTLYYRCTVHASMGGEIIVIAQSPLDLYVPYFSTDSTGFLLDYLVPYAASDAGLTLGSGWELYLQTQGGYSLVTGSFDTLEESAITPSSSLTLVLGDTSGGGGGDPGDGGGGSGPSVSISLPGSQQTQTVSYNDTDSVSEFIQTVETALASLITIPLHWALETVTGTLAIGSHMEGSPATLSSLGIYDGVALSLRDTTLHLTIEDRSSPTGQSVQVSVSSVAPLEKLKLVVVDIITGPVGPPNWELLLLDDKQTSDPSDDSLYFILGANSTQSDLAQRIDTMGIPESAILIYSVPPVTNSGVNIQLPDETLLTLTVASTDNLGNLLNQLQSAAFNVDASLPTAYQLVYVDATAQSVVVASSSMRWAVTTPSVSDLPVDVLDGTTPLLLVPMLQVRLPFPTSFFHVDYDATAGEYRLNGDLSPTLLMQRGLSYTFQHMSMTGTPYAGPELVLSSAAPGTDITEQNTLAGSVSATSSFFSFMPATALNGPIYYRSPSDVDLGGEILLFDHIPTELLLPYDPAQTTADLLNAVANAIQQSGAAETLPAEWKLELEQGMSVTEIVASEDTLQDLGITPYPSSGTGIAPQLVLSADTGDSGGGGGENGLTLTINYESQSIQLTGVTSIGDLVTKILNSSLQDLPSLWDLLIYGPQGGEFFVANEGQAASTNPLPQVVMDGSSLILQAFTQSDVFVSSIDKQFELSVSLDGLTTVGELIAAVASAPVSLPSQWILAMPNFDGVGIVGLTFLDDTTQLLDELGFIEDLLLIDLTPFTITVELPNEATFEISQLDTLSTVASVRQSILDTAPGLGYTPDIDFALYFGATAMTDANMPLAFYGIFTTATLQVDPPDPFANATAVSTDDPASNAILLKDGSVFFIRRSADDSTIAITDNGRPADYLIYSGGPWNVGPNQFVWEQETAIAVEWFESEQLYKLVIRGDRIFRSGQTTSDTVIQEESYWSIVAIDATGAIRWDKGQWLQSIVDFETDFGQDLNNEDGDNDPTTGIGFDAAALLEITYLNASQEAVAYDTDTVRAKMDAENNVYIFDGTTDPATNLLITEAFGPARLQFAFTWENGSNKATVIALRSTAEGYELIRQFEDTWTDASGASSNSMSWEVITTNGQGVIETYLWRQSVVDLEVTFNQDLNLDGAIGFNTANLVLLGTADNGTELRDDTSGFLYLLVEDSPYTVADSFGNPLRLQFEDIYPGGSHKQTAVALAYDDDANEYILVIKIEDIFQTAGEDNGSGGSSGGQPGYPGTLQEDGTFQPTAKISYALHFLSISGSSAIPDWSRQVWTESLSSFELRLGEDLDNDGTVGINSESLTAVDTDTAGLRLLKDAEGTLFIATFDTETQTHSNLLPITDQWGGFPRFDSNFSDMNFAEVSAAFAVEAEPDTVNPVDILGYRLAVRRASTHSFGEEQESFINWEVHFINPNGVLQWDAVSFGSVTSWEPVFKQDLDGDGSIGFDPANLDGVTTDPADASKVYPKLDRNGAIYVHDPDTGNFLPVIDQWGGTPTFNQRGSWADGSYSSSVYAAEKLADGSYLLVIYRQDTWKNPGGQSVTNSNYEGYTLTDDGSGKLVLSWENVAWYQSLAPMETAFAIDLDSDGIIGVNFSAINFVEVATDGGDDILVRADDANADTADPLYIRSGTTTETYSYLPIVDSYGGAPAFLSSWGGEGSGGTGSEAAYAVEQLDGGGYRLAVLNTFTNTFGEGDAAVTETFKDWILFTLDDSVPGKAVLSWENSTWTQNIASAETDFNQDLNGDGVIGTNYTVANLTYVETDSRGDSESAGYGSNAHLMLIPTDKSLFIEYPTGTLVPVTDMNGYAMQFHRSGKWQEADGSVAESRSVPVAVEAVFEDDNTTLKHFLLAVRNRNTFGGQTRVDWEIHTISPAGVLDWNLAAWTSSVIAIEERFHQDLNDDGGIGLTNITLPAVDSDKSGVDAANGNVDFLFRDSSNALYILPAGSTTYIPIKDSYGGVPSFDWSNNWGDSTSSSSAIAVEGQDDGTFLLAIRRIERFGSDPARTNWELFTIDSNGILQWESGQWLQSIGRREPLFRQDLNGDGVMGFNAASLNLANVGQADSTGAVLQRADNGDLYIKVDASTLIPVLDEFGNPMRFNYSFTDGSSSFTEEAMAVRMANGGSGAYPVLVVRVQNTFEGSTSTEWRLFSLRADGVVVWTENSILYTRSISKFEPDFGWDINGNGTVGIDVSLNTPIATDTVNQGLERDPDGGLAIVDGSTRVAVVDEGGNSVRLEYNESWDGGTSTKVAYATAKQDNGTSADFTDDFYLLALKITDTYGTTTQTYWEIFRISLLGVLDWSSGSWSSGIAKSEVAFDQDLNNDGVKGVRQAALSNSAFDTSGAKLKRDTEKGLYIEDLTVSSAPIAIVDSNGGMPLFDFSDTWPGGSFAAVSHAVEKQGDGTYRLAIKFTETTLSGSSIPIETVNWEVYSISSTGVLDWNSAKRNASIQPYEALFNQDLDGDGTIGLATATLTAIATDTTGVRLRRNSANNLFIRLLDDSTLTVIDAFGFQPVLHESFTLPDGTTVVKEPYAVQGFTYTDPDTSTTETRYKLVVRETVTSPAGVVDFNYEGYTVLANGTILWESFSRTETAKPWESVLNQDINGNGEIEVVGAARNLTDITTDTTGATLQTDEDGILYIRNGANRITVKDSSGGTPNFSISETFANGSFVQTPFAVALQNNSTPNDSADDFYLLAIREVATVDGVTEVFWKLFRVSLTGVMDWNSIQYKLNTELNETRFNQDMNGDGTVSNGVSDSNSLLGNLVQNGSSDPVILAAFGNRAQSELITITGKDGSNKITFFSEGDQNGPASSYDVSLGVVQNVTEGVEAKMGKDAGVDADIAALTDLLNFTIEITDPNKHGKIHKMTFALPPGATNVTYFKLNVKTGQYFEFIYDPVTGEGARIESSDPTQNLADVLAVYIRDNGKYDEDARLGFIRDPGALSETGLSAWRTNNAISNNELDTDGDGSANIMEYLVDSDPNTANLLRINATVADIASNDHLMLQVMSARSSEPAGVLVQLEGSDDLVTFSVVAHTHSVVNNGDGTFTHTYMQNAPFGDPAHKKFIRLKVTEAP